MKIMISKCYIVLEVMKKLLNKKIKYLFPFLMILNLKLSNIKQIKKNKLIIIIKLL
jgi:hypothetical protein